MEDEKVNKPDETEATAPPPAEPTVAAEVGEQTPTPTQAEAAAPAPEAVPPSSGPEAVAAGEAVEEAPATTDQTVVTPAAAAATEEATETTTTADTAPEPVDTAAEAVDTAAASETVVTGVPPAPAAVPATATAARAARAPLDPTGRGGTASILAGVAVIAPVLIRELTRGSDPYLLLPVSLILLAVALGGLRVAQSGKDGKLGRVGFLVASLGALVLTLMLLVIAYNDMVLNTRLQTGALLLDLGFYALVGGIILFGVSSLQAGVLARGPMLLLVLAVPIGIALDLLGAFEGNRRFLWGPGLALGAGLHLGLKIMGLALIWMGYSILKATKARTSKVRARAA